MIQFFRKIRQRLVAEKKLSNYLVYAAGEILLVVIGILIALAINNANQRRVLREKEQTYLQGLQEEFHTSQLKLKALMDVNQQHFEGAKELLGYISNTMNLPSEAQFSEVLFNTFSSDISFNPNNSLLNEIINSGSLKDISNGQLRILLTNWIATLENVAKQETELGIQREKVLDMFRSNEQSLRTVFDQTGVTKALGLEPKEDAGSNLMLLESTAFENNLLMFILTTSAMEEAHYQPLMADVMTILELIGEELR